MQNVTGSRTAGAAPSRPGSGVMFDGIARRYDLLNRILSFGLDRLWRRRLVASLAVASDWQVLDLATGTGDVALEVLRQQPGATVVGLDPSSRMLEVGERKVAAAGLAGKVTLQQGQAEALPAADDAFDAVTIAWGIRNVVDRRQALREMARVLRPGGKLAILESIEPRPGLLSSPARFYLHHVVPRIGAWLSQASAYRYLQTSIEAFPPPDVFARMVEEAGLEVIAVRPQTFGVCCLFVARKSALGDNR